MSSKAVKIFCDERLKRKRYYEFTLSYTCNINQNLLEKILVDSRRHNKGKGLRSETPPLCDLGLHE